MYLVARESWLKPETTGRLLTVDFYLAKRLFIFFDVVPERVQEEARMLGCGDDTGEDFRLGNTREDASEIDDEFCGRVR